MSSSQHFQKDSEASGQENTRQSVYYPGEHDEAEEPTTPRLSSYTGISTQDSGSETETELSRNREKRKRSKGKGKEKETEKSREKDKDRHHHHRHHHTQQDDKQKQPAAMSSSRAGKTSSSGRRHTSGKGKAKTDDWSEVTDPEERRRIQNRIAQRKFREKAREQKERAERDQRNQEHAASSYSVPGPEDLADEEELSGVPWGGPSIRYVIAKGHEMANAHQSGSRRTSTYMMDDTGYSSSSVSGATMVPLTTDAMGPIVGTSMAGGTPGAYSFSEESQAYMQQYATDSSGSQGGSRSSSDYSQSQLHQNQFYDDSAFYYDYGYDSAGR